MMCHRTQCGLEFASNQVLHKLIVKWHDIHNIIINYTGLVHTDNF